MFFEDQNNQSNYGQSNSGYGQSDTYQPAPAEDTVKEEPVSEPISGPAPTQAPEAEDFSPQEQSKSEEEPKSEAKSEEEPQSEQESTFRGETDFHQGEYGQNGGQGGFYGQNPFAGGYPPPFGQPLWEKRQKDTFGILALVCAIVSTQIGMFGGMGGIVTGVFAIIFAFMSKKRSQRGGLTGLGKAAIIVGAVGLVFSIFMTIVVMLPLEDAINSILKEYEQWLVENGLQP